MMKKILSILAASVMTMSALTGAMTASASEVATGQCGDNVTWTLDSEGVLTISGEGNMYTGNWLSNNEFKTDVWTYLTHSEDIKKVIVEEGVTSIGCGAFYQCKNLETAVIPSTIKKFDGRETYPTGRNSGDKMSFAFAECTSLKNLTLTEGMTSIGGHAFEDCTSLESVVIPSTITEWGNHSFNRCTSLKDITLKEGITIMGASAFRESAVESIVIPSTIESWPSDSHRDRALTEFGFDERGYAFRDCQNLKSVTFTPGLKLICNGAFYNCSNLKKVFIPASVTNLYYGFARCSGLEEVEIEEGSEMTQLSNYAFLECENLKTLEIPAGIEISYTNGRWGMGCDSLESIYLHNKNIVNFFSYTPNDTVTYYCYPDSETYNTMQNRSFAVKDITGILSQTINNFNSALDEAKGKAESSFTPESYERLKTVIENVGEYGEDSNILSMKADTAKIREALDSLVKKPTEPSKNPSSSNNQTSDNNKKPTAVTPTKVTRNPGAVAKEKKAALKAMKQAKLNSLKVKSKSKRKINVTWKKVKKAKGYEVQVSTNKKFKKSKIIFKKDVKNTKLTIKNKKIKSKKTYYVRVRAYAVYKDTNNKTVKVYSKWNKQLRKVKVK